MELGPCLSLDGYLVSDGAARLVGESKFLASTEGTRWLLDFRGDGERPDRAFSLLSACASAFGLAAAATACIRGGLLRLRFEDGDRLGDLLGLRLLSRDLPLECDRLLGLGLRFL